MPNDPSAPADDAEAVRRLLIVVDESPLGAHTAALGVAVAASMSAEVLFHLPIPWEHVEAKSPSALSDALAEHREACRERAKAVFEAMARTAAQFGVRCEHELTIEEEPGEAARRLAREHGCRMIVIGSQGRGAVARVLSGSLVDDLVLSSDVPVLVCRATMGFGRVAPLPQT